MGDVTDKIANRREEEAPATVVGVEEKVRPEIRDRRGCRGCGRCCCGRARFGIRGEHRNIGLLHRGEHSDDVGVV